MMITSWAAWAHSLTGLTPTEHITITAIADLADARGVAIVSTAYLATASGRGERSIRRAMASLEAARHLVRERRRTTNGAWSASRVQLLAHISYETEDTFEDGDSGGFAALPRLDIEALEPPEHPVSNDELRTLLRRAHAEQWAGEAASRLSTLLVSHETFRFGRIMRRRHHADAWDTLSRAWEALTTSADDITRAREPWAMWVTITARACARADAGGNLDQISLDPGLLAHLEATEIISASGADIHGIDDFGERTTAFITGLIDAGVEETIAWAGTARIIELVGLGPSRRHWAAGRDPRLADLGITDEGARAWMNAIAGSRRGTPGIFEMTLPGVAHKARQVATLITGQTYQKQHDHVRAA